MTQKTTTPEPKASSTWEQLEDFVREHVQQFIQARWKKKSRSYWGERSRRGGKPSMPPLGIAMAMANPDASP